MINRKIEAILFDFDGTIADTSEDMVGCLNILLKNHSKEDVDISKAKKFISKGAAGLINFAFPKIPDEEKKLYISEYLEIYKNNLFIKTKLFSGIEELILSIIKKQYKWGIVTNKPSYLVNPIIEKINFTYSPNCVVAGDTLSVKKPNPEPLIHAAKIIGCNPSLCAYVGDDIRDITAANSAGMISVAALYGFIEDLQQVKEWGSDYMIYKPLDLESLIV